MKIVDFQSWYFSAEIGEFGTYLQPGVVYTTNLMKPPGDERLCSFPENFFDNVNNSAPVEIVAPVGLLISHGECNPLDKIRVALDMQQKVPGVIKYIIMYNNDPDNPDDIVSLRPPSHRLPSDDFEALGLISVSTVSGGAILKRIDDLSNKTGRNPQILQPGNRDWEMKAEFSRVEKRSDRKDPYTTSQANPGSFYWFRLVLFTLLIVSPCCRAGYLWWAGGGRIRFRHNERGQIVGFQYIPPISDWFVSTGIHAHGTPLTERLTEEQVLALPEIKFKPSIGFETEDDEDIVEELDQDVDEKEIVIGCGSADESRISEENQDPEIETPQVPAGIADDDDEEQPRELGKTSQNHETTCTTCSICIDDFESGELIRILPRCRHAFHTDCIMPWLTERQGCCPLCKTNVLGEDNGSDVTGESTVDIPGQVQQHEASGQSEMGIPDADIRMPSDTDVRIVANLASMAVLDAPEQTENVAREDANKESESGDQCNPGAPTMNETGLADDISENLPPESNGKGFHVDNDFSVNDEFNEE